MTNITVIMKILKEAELLGIELELPEYFDELDPESRNAEADKMNMVLEKAKHEQFITNAHKRDEAPYCRSLCAGYGGKRRIIVLSPLQTEKYSVEQLEETGMVGLYDHAQKLEEK